MIVSVLTPPQIIVNVLKKMMTKISMGEFLKTTSAISHTTVLLLKLTAYA